MAETRTDRDQDASMSSAIERIRAIAAAPVVPRLLAA